MTLAVALGGSGAFSGEVTATPGDRWPPLRVPVGVVKESTRHVLRLRGLDRNGTSNVETLVTVINLRDVTASPPDPVLMSGGEATVRVVPGFYTITAAIPTLGDGEPPPDLGGTADLVGPPSPSPPSPNRRSTATWRSSSTPGRPDRSRPACGTWRRRPTDVHVFLAVQDRRRNGFVLGYDTSAEDVIAGHPVRAADPAGPARPVRGQQQVAAGHARRGGHAHVRPALRRAGVPAVSHRPRPGPARVLAAIW